MKIVFIIIFTIFSSTADAFQTVDINSASVEQIALLSGIGKKLAEKIVRFRKNHRFAMAEDLLLVEGMTKKRFEQIHHQVVVRSIKNVKKNIIPPPEVKTPFDPSPIISIELLEKRALKVFELSADVNRSRSIRVRRSSWLPKLSLYIDTDTTATSTRKALDQHDISDLRRGGRNIGFGVRASFDLDKLIFNGEELEVAKLHIKQHELRDELITKLHKNYFNYIALAETLVEPSNTTLRQSLQAKMHELRAVLDSMSDNAFSDFRSKNSAPGEK